jgi:hypothetical protein
MHGCYRPVPVLHASDACVVCAITTAGEPVDDEPASELNETIPIPTSSATGMLRTRTFRMNRMLASRFVKRGYRPRLKHHLLDKTLNPARLSGGNTTPTVAQLRFPKAISCQRQSGHQGVCNISPQKGRVRFCQYGCLRKTRFHVISELLIRYVRLDPSARTCLATRSCAMR